MSLLEIYGPLSSHCSLNSNTTGSFVNNPNYFHTIVPFVKNPKTSVTRKDAYSLHVNAIPFYLKDWDNQALSLEMNLHRYRGKRRPLYHQFKLKVLYETMLYKWGLLELYLLVRPWFGVTNSLQILIFQSL